jgi:hypothetical protein
VFKPASIPFSQESEVAYFNYIDEAILFNFSQQNSSTLVKATALAVTIMEESS